MKCLDKFKKKMNLSGGSLREEIVKNNRELLEETFADDASIQIGVYFWELGKKSYDKDVPICLRFYERAFSNANGSTVKFQTLLNTPIIVGDVIYNSRSEEYYICTESFNIDDIHWQGKLTLCNWILKWQKKTGEILEYPCHDINSTQYNSGEQSNKQFTIGSSQHMITLPCDENTVALSSPQRFFLDKNKESPTSFIVTQNDTTSYNYGKKGLVKVTLYEHVLNKATDRPDLGICDYIDTAKTNDCLDSYYVTNTVKTNDRLNGYYVVKSEIEFKTKVIKSGGNAQLFIGKFFDNKGNEITDKSCKWEIFCDFIDSLIIEESENQIRISIDNDDYIDEEFKLSFSDIDGQYISSLIISVGSLL